jgi:hypothetical protein
VKGKRFFRGTRRVNVQEREISQVSCLLHVAFFLVLLFDPEDGGDLFL